MKKKLLLFLVPLLLTTLYGKAQTIRYVKAAAAGSGNGSSWGNASSDLQSMINQSDPGDQVWVASGTYKPVRRADMLANITPNNRNNAFVLKKDVRIYGGFSGAETDTAQRINPPDSTILSGDFNGDDMINGSGYDMSIIGNAENAYHVVMSIGDAGTALLDGFTITGGNSSLIPSDSIFINGETILASRGGGLYNCYSSPAVNRCIFIANSASLGGAVLNYNASPAFTQCVLTSNYAVYNGGAMWNTFSSSPVFSHCEIKNNKSLSAGAVYTTTDAPYFTTFIECIISENSSTYYGGGFFNAGGSSAHQFISCTFTKNAATYGGAIYNSSATTRFIQCLFSNNNASSGAGLYNNSGAFATFTGCTLTGNKALMDGGGLLNSSNSLAILDHCVLTADSASFGGAIGNDNTAFCKLINSLVVKNYALSAGGGVYNKTSKAKVLITNSTISGNTAYLGPELCQEAGGDSIVIHNSIVWPNKSEILFKGGDIFSSHSLVQGIAGGSNGNISGTTDPLFTDISSDNYSPRPGSPCINRGNNSFYTDASLVDLVGNPRVFDTIIDMGPYERQMKPQYIIVADTIRVAYGSDPIHPATSSSNLPVTYASADNSIASIDGDGNIANHKGGTVKITISLAGDTIYDTSLDKEIILIVTPVELMVTADAGQNKVYGQPDPEYTYVVSGFINGDDQTLITGKLGRAAGENAGAYAITLGSLNAGSSYAISYTGKYFNITKASLNIMADAKIKQKGTFDPVFTYTYSGLVNNDDKSAITGRLVRDPGEGVGTYAITKGNLSCINYDIIYTGNYLTITNAALGIADIAGKESLLAYPNPVNAGEMLTISSNYSSNMLEGARFIIRDMTGKVWQQVTGITPDMQIAMPDAEGLYMVSLVLGNGQQAHIKVLVQ